MKDKFGRLKVCYDRFGFPDFKLFTPVINDIICIVPITDMAGNTTTDFSKANQELSKRLGISPTNFRNIENTDLLISATTGVAYTWHHHQDGIHMMLVPSTINAKFNHVGGASERLRSNYRFPDPFKISISFVNCN